MTHTERTLTRGAATGTLHPDGELTWNINTDAYRWEADVRQVADELLNDQYKLAVAGTHRPYCGYIGCGLPALAFTNTCAQHDRGDGRPRNRDADVARLGE